MTTEQSVAEDQLQATTWTAHNEQAFTATLGGMVRTLPSFARIVVRLAWQCSRSWTVAVLILQLVAAAVTTVGLLGAARVLAEILGATDLRSGVLSAVPTMAMLAGLSVAGALAHAGVAAGEARLAPGVRRLAEEQLVTAVSDVELASFDEPDFHDALIRARDRGVHTIDSAVVQLIELLGSIVSLLGVGTALGALNPLLLPLLVASTLPTAWATMHNARLGYATFWRTMAITRRLRRICELMTDRESAAPVRAFTARSFLLGRYRTLASQVEWTEVRLRWRQTRLELVGQTGAGTMVLLSYAVLIGLVSSQHVAVAAAGTTVIALQSGRGTLARATMVMNLLYEQSLYVLDFGQVLDQAKSSWRSTDKPPVSGSPSVIGLRGVTFRYPGADRAAISGLDLTISRGDVVALVGENGSGKSTLAKLLGGLYLPDQGQITWDGVDLATVDAESIRARVSSVLQEPSHWPLTAEQYVTLGQPPRSPEERARLEEALLASGSDAVIGALSAGWNTLLSKEFKGGAALSVGQWQRLALARALYREGEVLIVDEPTAPLDPRAEALVYESLRRAAGHRTIVLITHRLASARTADQIAVLRDGRLIELGTHDELMALLGHYADLYTLQAGPGH
ncbi:ATP-binding cassette domain-containing protein [Streptomyces sp. SID13031]|uniref:ABC transporter ATP-binding protein n=1 Tax=Streptomyces sp. SID13031 TaxID=2706046 RepID=UPI0013C82BB7|nr:ATP-binding cassette domain-containing protein [Streptomyces sp. SID13031]NEA34318.1 ATP-binding cassette domain-containing protein [Streptomyces sp. SID13031]